MIPLKSLEAKQSYVYPKRCSFKSLQDPHIQYADSEDLAADWFGPDGVIVTTEII